MLLPDLIYQTPAILQFLPGACLQALASTCLQLQGQIQPYSTRLDFLGLPDLKIFLKNDWSKLTSVDLRSCSLDGPGITQLAAACLPKLKQLDLRSTDLDAAMLSSLSLASGLCCRAYAFGPSPPLTQKLCILWCPAIGHCCRLCKCVWMQRVLLC